MPIDRNRPLMDIMHIDGRRCIMYFDDPGVYLHQNGTRMSESDARSMGADIEKYKKERMMIEMRQKKSDELTKFSAELEKKTSLEMEIALEGGVQKIDRSAYPNLEPMGFDSEGRLRETSKLMMVEGKVGFFDVIHKDSTDVIAEKVKGVDGVRAMLNWHEDHPDEESVEDLFASDAA
jgi:hypothetical protein